MWRHEGVRDSVTGITYQPMTLAPSNDAASPFADHLLVELVTIFSPHQCITLLGLCLVPSALVTQPGPDVKKHLAKLVDL